ncbi:MAG: formamidopyrimidine-DNA glycosylase [Acidimicrobiales bacterium]|jgi:formamidopyrimidine-DNA glycosylase
MPEMPEIQAHAERMTIALVGARLKNFQLLNFAGLKTFSPAADEAKGATVVNVTRRAKYLLINFDNDQSHAIHLMQGGRLRPDQKQSKKPRNGIARWVFEDLPDGDGPSTGVEAWLLTEAGTERKAGIWAVAGEPVGQDPLSGLGPEADQIDRDQLADLLRQHSRRLHGLLRTQSVLAGLGRLLTNEVLYEAALSPFVNAAKLTDTEIDRLHAAIEIVVGAAIEHERSLDDIGKSADRPSKVHNRSGEPCLGVKGKKCDDTVHTVEYRKYTVVYCPTRQTGGKKLADNTTSKFLK